MENEQRPSWTSWAWPAAFILLALLMLLLLLYPLTLGTWWAITVFGV